ncbi:hypothetical protein V8E36_003021 [Tilletia maclaganii]
MFKTANPYDEPVTKATDENLTSEDWEANLDVCDKVSGEGEQGARNCIAAIRKRLAHRSANVQLYALILTDSLSKNAGVNAHREIASRSFSQTLVRLATDKNTHESVKRKTYSLVKEWTRDYGNEPDLGIISETYATLQKQLGHRYDENDEPAPAEPSTDELRREDEELRRVLELSVRDQGGRQAWTNKFGYEGGQGSGSGSGNGAPAASSSAVGPSGASNTSAAARPSVQASAPVSNVAAAPVVQPAAHPVAAAAPAQAPAITMTSATPTSATSTSGAIPPTNNAATTATPATATAAAAPAKAAPPAPTISRVRALYDFKPSEAGELGFSKGDVIRVLNAVYDHWWRGELRGDVGIFPVNYVEILPDPTPADLQKEAEMEARVFDQAASIDSLLNKLKDLDPTRDNLADDEELQELYQVSLSMRPKIIRLIDRYSAKITELKAMNDKFVRARGTFDRLMEESLAKYNPGVQSNAYTQVRPEYAGAVASAASQQPYGYGYPVQGQQQVAQQLQTQPPAALGQGQAQQLQPQQQQDYAKAWAEWYAQNGYPEQAAQAAAAAAAAAAAGQPHDFSQYAQPQLQQAAAQPQQQQQQQQPVQGGAAAGYGAQPQQWAQPSSAQPQGQQQPQQQQQQQQAQGPPSGAAGLPTPAGPSATGDVPHDDEKRRLYERARAETEAFQRSGGGGVHDHYGAYNGGAGASGSSGSGASTGAGPSGNGSGGGVGAAAGGAGSGSLLA